MTPYRPLSYLEHRTGVAVWETGVQITFPELTAKVRDNQRSLAARGVREGDVVGVQRSP